LAQEHIIQQNEHYNLFTKTAYNTIYSHVTKYFGLDDLFEDHKKFIRQFVTVHGGTFNPINGKGINYYDAVLQDALNYPRQGATNNTQLLIKTLCEKYQENFYESIQPDVLVLRSLLVYIHKGQINNDFKFFHTFENILKSRCLCGFAHNQMLAFNHYVKHPTKCISIPQPKVAYYHRCPMTSSYLYHQFGEESDFRYCSIKENQLSIQTHLKQVQNMKEEIYKNVERQQIKLRSLNPNQMSKKAYEHQIKNIVEWPPCPKTLKQICQEFLTLIGGHSVSYLQPENEKINTLVRMPVPINPLQVYQYSMAMWCKALSLKINFSEDMKFLLFSSSMPKVNEKYKKNFYGRYIIMAYGMKVVIYNVNTNKFIWYYHNYCIEMADHNFKVWMPKITSSWHPAHIKAYKFVHYSDGPPINIYIDKIKNVFLALGFQQSDYVFLWERVNKYRRNGF